MGKWILALSALLLAETFFPPASAQEGRPASSPPGAVLPAAETVFADYLRSRGGAHALEALRVIERIGWISVDAGQTGLLAGTYHTCLKYPNRLAIEIDAGVWQQAQALRESDAVECEQGFRNCRPAKPEVKDELIDTARHANKDLLQDADLWRKATVTATGDGMAWRLARIDGQWAEFDRTDGHLRALGRGTQWRHLGRWQTVEDVAIPFRLEDFAVIGTETEWKNTVYLHQVRITDAPSAWCTARFGER